MKRPLFFGCICLIALIALWTCYHDAPPFYVDLPVKEGEHVIITGQVYQKEYRSYYGTDQTNLYLRSIKIIHSDTGQVSKLNPKFRIICEFEDMEQEPELGRSLRISGTWHLYGHATNPGEFDLADYYASRNIIGKLEDCSADALGKQFWRLREGLLRLRNLLKGRLYEALPEKEASILAKMLLGENSGLDAEVKALYQRNGIVHILSISGLHITMIGMGVYRLLRKGGCPVVPAAAAGVVFLLLYGCMTGFGISCCRAIGMYLIHMLGEITGRSYDLLTATGILMAVMLCSNPRLIYHCGFLLSFASVCAVGCLYPVLQLQEAALKKGPVPPPLLVCFLIKWCGGMLQGLWASASISIFTLPVMLYYFYEIPVYSPFVNLLVLPFMGIIMAAGIVLMILPDFPVLAEVEHIILGGYEGVCLLFEELPYHTWLTGRPTYWQIAVYYAGILSVIWLCTKKSRWWAVGIAAFVLFLGTDFEKEYTVSFLNVGQGDCIVVMTEEGRTYLFDGGSSSEKTVGEDIILPFLKYHGVSVIDGVFISHPDEDHISGIMEMLEQEPVDIRNIYLPDVHKDCRDDFQDILAGVSQQKVRYYSAGDYLREDKLIVRCLHPIEDFSADTNVYSGCFLLECGKLKVLLTGDVEEQGELLLTQYLQKQGIDEAQVLKVAHHGSKYSTGKAFLDTVTVQLAVISCGEDNRYGHPHGETLERLEDAGIPYGITYETGCITVTEAGYFFYRR